MQGISLLSENEGGQTVFAHQFHCHLLQAFCRHIFDVSEERSDVAFPTIMQETLAKIKGEVLPIVAGYADLSLDLLLSWLPAIALP